MTDGDVEPLLTDGVVSLRPFAESDVEPYVSQQDAEMARGFEWAGAATVAEVRAAGERWAESWRTQGVERNFAIVDCRTGEMIGNCEAEARPDGYVNVMYAVFSRWRRRGVATRALRLLLAYAAAEFPNHRPLFRVHPDNEASLAVARRCGATVTRTELPSSGRELQWLTIDAPAGSA